MKRPDCAAHFAQTMGKLFPGKLLGFADFAADFSRAPFNGAFCFHAPVAQQPASLLFCVAFNLSCASARSVSSTAFHNSLLCRNILPLAGLRHWGLKG
jgi:hypothetical protein